MASGMASGMARKISLAQYTTDLQLYWTRTVQRLHHLTAIMLTLALEVRCTSAVSLGMVAV
jgi:hypothetical protein